MKNALKQREVVSLLFIIVLFLIVGIFNSKFLALGNIFQILNSTSVNAFVALGMAFVLFIGEIDVSVGATLGLTAAVAGTFSAANMPAPLIFLVAIIVGAVIGLINGIGVVVFKIPSIIMTLGTMGIIRGVMYIYTNGQWLQNFANSFVDMSQAKLANTLSYIFIIVLLITVGLYYFTKLTMTGKSFKAVGDNIDGAQLIGIPVNRIKFYSFIICGIASGIAGVLYASRIGFVTPTDGTGYEMTAIAACVIGGISLSGGEGTTFGSIIGSILMTSISSILVFLGFSSTFNNTITGAILIAIVVIGAVTSRRSAESLRKARLLARVSEKGE